MSQAPCFTLYSRSWCHLCENMLEALRVFLAGEGLACSVDVVDVDADPLLVERYDELVPVLTLGPDGPEICHYHLDTDALREALRQRLGQGHPA
jgi:hypothetical protein